MPDASLQHVAVRWKWWAKPLILLMRFLADCGVHWSEKTVGRVVKAGFAGVRYVRRAEEIHASREARNESPASICDDWT